MHKVAITDILFYILTLKYVVRSQYKKVTNIEQNVISNPHPNHQKMTGGCEIFQKYQKKVQYELPTHGTISVNLGPIIVDILVA